MKFILENIFSETMKLAFIIESDSEDHFCRNALCMDKTKPADILHIKRVLYSKKVVSQGFEP